MDWTFGHNVFFNNDLSTKHDSANHRLEGILIVKGPGIKKAETISGAGIIDLAPTILFMMGLPVPSDMDGKVLIEAFNPSYLKSNPIMYEKETRKPRLVTYEWSKEEQERIKKRLEALGYL
jgi:hypothetical protein